VFTGEVFETDRRGDRRDEAGEAAAA
jgi:hypothetical protein